MINKEGGRAVGLSGKDGALVMARKLLLENTKEQEEPPEIIDLGRVGEVASINPEVILALERERFIPVIAPVGVGPEGGSYNINADLVAGAVAASLEAEKLILLTDVEGVMDEAGKLVSTLTARQAREMIRKGVIRSGMIPKVSCCLDAIAHGVKKAHIVDGRQEHAVLLEIFTDVGVGTEIVP